MLGGKAVKQFPMSAKDIKSKGVGDRGTLPHSEL